MEEARKNFVLDVQCTPVQRLSKSNNRVLIIYKTTKMYRHHMDDV